MQDQHTTALIWIFIGAGLSLFRDTWAAWCVRLYVWIRKQDAPKKFIPLFALYFMITGMFFTVMGLLGLAGVLPL